MRTDCPHGMPSPASCIDCMNEDGIGAPPKNRETVEYYFTAKFDGHCNECNLPTVVGQEIAKMSTGRYIHGSCADE